MKKITVTAISVLAGFGLGLLTGCASAGIKHVSADEFIQQAKHMEWLESASGTHFIGTSPARVYLERTGLYRVFRCHKAMVYWTELDGLPPDIREPLKEGDLPWTPWQEKKKE